MLVRDCTPNFEFVRIINDGDVSVKRCKTCLLEYRTYAARTFNPTVLTAGSSFKLVESTMYHHTIYSYTYIFLFVLFFTSYVVQQ